VIGKQTQKRKKRESFVGDSPGQGVGTQIGTTKKSQLDRYPNVEYKRACNKEEKKRTKEPKKTDVYANKE